ASLSDRGRMAVVLDTGAVSRGSGNQGSNRERDIRKAFVDADLIEAVILLPENLFYNTTAPGIILVINRRKRHPGEILLINASQLFAKGRPKNYLTDEHIATIAEIYHTWGNSVGAAHRDVGAHGNAPRSDTVGSRGVGAHGNAPIKSDVIGSRGVGAHGNAPRSDAVDVQGDVGSYGNVGAHGRAPLPPNGASATVHPYGGAPIYAIITREEAARNDYNLSPSRYVALGGTEETLPLEEAVVLLSEAEEERARADARLKEVLKTLNLVNGNAKNEPVGKPDAGVQTPVDG
ncbi:MAG: N-6 DNA methylase, partial [Armatimonadota bacterium]